MSLTVLPGPLLSERTTLALGGRALAEVAADTPADLDNLPSTLHKLGGMPLVLSKGSNLLAHDRALPLVVVTIRYQEITLADIAAESVTLQAGAGLSLSQLLGWLANHGLAGLERLAGIPGSLGGAVKMNAGSWGVDIGHILTRVQVFTPKKGLIWLSNGEFTMSYRRFALVHPTSWFVVTAAELTLRRKKSERIWQVMREHYKNKKAVQPLTAKSCGCAFKNPHGPPGTLSAGKLLDQIGLRGFRLGGMEFSAIHANFLVNNANGTSTQALELLALAESMVKAQYGINLEREIQVIPCP
ncbi:UDP-N-acetylenolpyruvoylglucosamine reductase [Desulfovibrionales bacterium]